MADPVTTGYAAGTDQVPDSLGQQGAVGQLEVTTGGGQDQDAVAVDEFREDANAVFKATLFPNIVLGHVVTGIYFPGVPYAQGHAEVTQLGTLAARHEAFQGFDGHHCLLATLHLAPGQVVRVGTVIAQQMHEIEIGEIAGVVDRAPGAGNGVQVLGDQAAGPGLLEGLAQERREHLVLFAGGLHRPLAVGPVPVGLGVGFYLLYKTGFVDPRHGKHHRGADHVLRGLLDGGRPRPVHDIAVPGSVHHPFGPNCLPTRLALDDGADDPIAIHQGGDEQAVQHGGDPRFGHQGVRYPFEGFAVDGVAVGLGLLHRGAGGNGPLFKLDAQALTVHGVLVAVPGKALDTHRRDIASETAKAFQKGHLNPGPRCGEGGREAPGARTDHQHLGFVDHRQSSGGFINMHGALSLLPASLGAESNVVTAQPCYTLL